MYIIKQEEPEGWAEAFAIYFAGKRVAVCSYRDTAVHWVKDQTA